MGSEDADELTKLTNEWDHVNESFGKLLDILCDQTGLAICSRTSLAYYTSAPRFSTPMPTYHGDDSR